jgi:chorismate mutase/prephenate dehydratase
LSQDLPGLRGEIDAVDAELTRLFVRRMQVAGRIGALKRSAGLPVLDPAREQAVLAARTADLPDPALIAPARAFFETLMRLSREHQANPTDPTDPTGADAKPSVAYQGVPGAFGHQAALQWGGADAGALPCRAFEDVFRAVAEGRAARGVLPLENSSAGGIADVYDLLGAYGCRIVGETLLPVAHCLLGLPGARPDGLRAVYSHDQGFLQCKAFLARHPDWEQRPALNTAVAAQSVAERGDPGLAAIASRLAAECYGLEILAADIQTLADNATRFIVVAADPAAEAPAALRDKATLAFALRHERGTLHRALAAFVALGTNLTRIESRPIPGKPWEYRFYVDVEGKLTPDKLDVLLEALEADCADCRVLGHYPAARRPDHGA